MCSFEHKSSSINALIKYHMVGKNFAINVAKMKKK